MVLTTNQIWTCNNKIKSSSGLSEVGSYRLHRRGVSRRKGKQRERRHWGNMSQTGTAEDSSGVDETMMAPVVASIFVGKVSLSSLFIVFEARIFSLGLYTPPVFPSGHLVRHRSTHPIPQGVRTRRRLRYRISKGKVRRQDGPEGPTRPFLS